MQKRCEISRQFREKDILNINIVSPFKLSILRNTDTNTDMKLNTL